MRIRLSLRFLSNNNLVKVPLRHHPIKTTTMNLSNYDFESNPLGLNEYEINLLKKHIDFVSYAQSLERDVKKSLKIGFVSSLSLSTSSLSLEEEQDGSIIGHGIVYGFGTNSLISNCIEGLLDEESLTPLIKRAMMLKALNSIVLNNINGLDEE